MPGDLLSKYVAVGHDLGKDAKIDGYYKYSFGEENYSKDALVEEGMEVYIRISITVTLHCECPPCSTKERNETRALVGNRINENGFLSHSTDRGFTVSYFSDSELQNAIDMENTTVGTSNIDVYTKIKPNDDAFTITIRCECQEGQGRHYAYMTSEDKMLSFPGSLCRVMLEAHNFSGFYSNSSKNEEYRLQPEHGFTKDTDIYAKYEYVGTVSVTTNCNCPRCSQTGEVVKIKQNVKKTDTFLGVVSSALEHHNTPDGYELRVFLDAAHTKPYFLYKDNEIDNQPSSDSEIWIDCVLREYTTVMIHCKCKDCVVIQNIATIGHYISEFLYSRHSLVANTEVEGYYYDAAFNNKIPDKAIVNRGVDGKIDVYVKIAPVKGSIKITLHCTKCGVDKIDYIMSGSTYQYQINCTHYDEGYDRGNLFTDANLVNPITNFETPLTADTEYWIQWTLK